MKVICRRAPRPDRVRDRADGVAVAASVLSMRASKGGVAGAGNSGFAVDRDADAGSVSRRSVQVEQELRLRFSLCLAAARSSKSA
jgi:hypothetical protein